MARLRNFNARSLLPLPQLTVPDVATPYATNLDYLQDELTWIQQRAHRINLQQKLSGAAQRPSWAMEDGPEIPRAQVEAMHEKAVRTEAATRLQIDARLELSRQEGSPTAMDEMCVKFELEAFERTILLLAIAPIFSRSFNDLFGRLHMDGGAACLDVETVFQFCELSYGERIERRRVFAPGASLARHDLALTNSRSRMDTPEDLLGATVQMTQPTFQFLIGLPGLGDEFAQFSSLEEPRADLEQIVLPEADRRRILSVVDNHEEYLKCRADWGLDEVIRYGKGILMLFHGKPGTGKTMTAHGVANHLGRRVLNVDIPRFLESRDADRFLPGLFREARLNNALLFFDECETLFASRRGGNALMTLLLTELERFEGVAILATNLPEALDEAFDRRILVKVHFAEPDRAARAEIWRKHLPKQLPLAADVDLQALADRFEMTGGYIKNAVLMAVASAVHDGHTPRVVTMAALEQAARDQMLRPGQEESELLRPKSQLKDVILSAALHEQVLELIDAARHRRTLLEKWGIGANLSTGKGAAALLSGPPGTGKTLCAEAIAAELNRPLMVAQVPALLSKWIGETEKNLAFQFAQAKNHGAVLLLDEADGLMGDRNGLTHKHDISVVNVMLQLIERHEGVVLLATNRADALDKALTRRLGWHLRFAMPDARLRAGIWRALLPETVPVHGKIDFERLGRNFALTGGHIKNAVFKAAFRAARSEVALQQAGLEFAAMEELEVVEPLNNGFAEG